MVHSLSVCQDLEAIKKRMQEMEEEAQKLREFQAEADDSLNLSGSTAPAATSPMLTPDEKKEIDGRSIYVGNVSQLEYWVCY